MQSNISNNSTSNSNYENSLNTFNKYLEEQALSVENLIKYLDTLGGGKRIYFIVSDACRDHKDFNQTNRGSTGISTVSFSKGVVLTSISMNAQTIVNAGFESAFTNTAGYTNTNQTAGWGYVLNGNVPYEGVNSNFPFRFDSLFLGVLLAFVKHKKWILYEKLKSPLIAIAGFFMFVGYIYYYWTLSYSNQLINSMLLPRTIGFFILPFTVALTVPYISTIKFNKHRNILTKAFYELITYTSVLTYAIYLIHTFIFPVILEHSNQSSSILQWVTALVLTYLISWFVYQTFEKPILNYRDKITSKS